MKKDIIKIKSGIYLRKKVETYLCTGCVLKRKTINKGQSRCISGTAIDNECITENGCHILLHVPVSNKLKVI